MTESEWPVKLRIECPWCGHGRMHFGEAADLRGETRSDLFSCRGCGSAYDAEDMEDFLRHDTLALAEIRRAVGSAGEGAER